jgi:mono/diheme cytochrome c family protein
MPIVTRHSLITVVVLVFASLLIVGLFLWSGIYNIGADDKHSRPVYSLLQVMRERSIAARAGRLHPPPNLEDPAMIRQGAGNYDAMCTACHLAPGMAGTELSKGLYPAPPDLTRETVDAASAFWVIKHGIKASGMPAWGLSMDDEYIWGMVAFLQQLPTLDAAQYQALVASSDGHSHGGGETGAHGEGDDHHAMPGMQMPAAMATDTDQPEAHGERHRHADGTVETHPAPPTRSITEPATESEPKPTTGEGQHDGHDHDH